MGKLELRVVSGELRLVSGVDGRAVASPTTLFDKICRMARWRALAPPHNSLRDEPASSCERLERGASPPPFVEHMPHVCLVHDFLRSGSVAPIRSVERFPR